MDAAGDGDSRLFMAHRSLYDPEESVHGSLRMIHLCKGEEKEEEEEEKEEEKERKEKECII